MALAAVLFFAAGILDGVYPGGREWITEGGVGYLSYVFGAINVAVAVWIWRGSEQGLLLRIVLAAFFFFERVLSAFAFGERSAESVAVHLLTALVELVILLGALQVWRLGHSVEATDLEAIFDLDAPLPAAPASRSEVVAVPPSTRPSLPTRTVFLIGLISVLLGAALVASGIVGGFVPGGRAWGLRPDSVGWLAYPFAAVLLLVSARAVRGSPLALRLQLAVSLLLFIERPFHPFMTQRTDVATLALSAVAAFLALTLALASMAGLRMLRASRPATTLERAAV